MRVLTIAVFVAFAVALVCLELLARYTRARVPSASALFRWVLRRRSAQLGMVMAWWWIGWHFLAPTG